MSDKNDDLLCENTFFMRRISVIGAFMSKNKPRERLEKTGCAAGNSGPRFIQSFSLSLGGSSSFLLLLPSRENGNRTVMPPVNAGFTNGRVFYLNAGLWGSRCIYLISVLVSSYWKPRMSRMEIMPKTFLPSAIGRCLIFSFLMVLMA